MVERYGISGRNVSEGTCMRVPVLAVACVLAGARSIAELDENLAMSVHAIPAAFWSELAARGLIAASAPVPAA